MLPMDPGQTVHVKVVDVAADRAGPVIEFEVLDEGPYLGEHVQGHPADELEQWLAAIFDTTVEPAVPVERILHRYCRAVIGVTGRIRRQCIVQDVLPP